MRIFCSPSLSSLVRSVLTMLCIGVTATFLSGCRPKPPKDIISVGKMERILYDFHMAQGYAECTPHDSVPTDVYRYELIQAVYRKHGITEEDFEYSMAFYCSDLQTLHKIYANLERRFEREAAAYGETNVKDVYSDLSADGDTANVWGGQPIMVVRNSSRENVLSWHQECDSTWLPGDVLLWRFNPQPFSSRRMSIFVADLVVNYTNDSVRAAVRSSSSSSVVELRVPNPDGWTPRSLSGHLYVPVNSNEQEQTTLAATQIMLIRFHTQKPFVAAKDSLTATAAADSLTTDTIDADSAGRDDERRLSPDEFRQQQPVDQKIDIVKQKPYVRQPQQGRRRMQPGRVIQRKRK
ncbi:MAG: DUF4296 domain-containing protein [Bacteroidales bacterium]|nr:DUF4296 domain-containing protein [Bacteroidales bacterium]